MFDLTGRVAVVTGGSSGLGVQFAHALGRQGATVIVIARRTHMLEKVAADIAAESGVKTGWYYCDVTRSDLVREVANKIEEEYGKIELMAATHLENEKLQKLIQKWRKEVLVEIRMTE